MTDAVLAAVLATVIVEESMGLSRWSAIRLARWAARHIYAGDPDLAAKRAEEWEEGITARAPSHIAALCLALSLACWALARIVTRMYSEGRSAMTKRRMAEVFMRWAARREYRDQPERARTRAEEWVNDIRQAAGRGLVSAVATGLSHVFSALWGPAHRWQRLGIDGDALMVQFEEGEIASDLLAEAVRALMRRARQSGWRSSSPFEPVRIAAVDRLSAGRAAQLAGVLLADGMPGEAAIVVQAWPVPEVTAHRSADDLIPICRALGAVWPGGPGNLARLLSGSVSHWAAGKRLQAEATINRELGGGQAPAEGLPPHAPESGGG